ncbi:Hypothetical protein CAP_2134 [Chondromyces apiculatus DSM 436]|uniref:Uncharacterized protein n=1 Tax=Chondromyces apiculatus DSM 436 TaxID=1192034 RepID=A0A017TCB1_9BACT|nr:Hypothetical protein CAP_2134 [Chondromyces apiculatus DSM 436]
MPHHLFRRCTHPPRRQHYRPPRLRTRPRRRRTVERRPGGRLTAERRSSRRCRLASGHFLALPGCLSARDPQTTRRRFAASSLRVARRRLASRRLRVACRRRWRRYRRYRHCGLGGGARLAGGRRFQGWRLRVRPPRGQGQHQREGTGQRPPSPRVNRAHANVGGRDRPGAGNHESRVASGPHAIARPPPRGEPRPCKDERTTGACALNTPPCAPIAAGRPAALRVTTCRPAPAPHPHASPSGGPESCRLFLCTPTSSRDRIHPSPSQRRATPGPRGSRPCRGHPGADG